jgi:hypothetical protein
VVGWCGSERVLNFSLTFKGFLSSFLEFQGQKFQGKKKLGAETEREERRRESGREREEEEKKNEGDEPEISVESWRTREKENERERKKSSWKCCFTDNFHKIVKFN